MSRVEKPTTESPRKAIVDLLALVHEIPSIKVAKRKERHSHLLQGLCFYVHDTVRNAVDLIDDGHNPSAAVLTRVAVEHAAMAQWIAVHPEGADKYLAELEAQSNTFVAKVRGVRVQIPEALAAEYRRYEKGKPVQDIRQTEKMFKAIDPSGWMYVQRKVLSQYVHPSGARRQHLLIVGGLTQT